MSLSLTLACVWVLAAAVVAMLPLQKQFAVGWALFVAAMILIAVIFYEHGWLFGGLALFGFVSMFRRPLNYYVRKWMGLPVESDIAEAEE
ncbi:MULTISPECIES: DUF2484 family protein [unclassified Shimia]|uniref:DUF2484 family protein n=1 Tax=unclassified Shimia TaxID=2630038 RepID=UPI001AD99414|nr:DUF2484 family protein [Shimia sp. R9_3]